MTAKEITEFKPILDALLKKLLTEFDGYDDSQSQKEKIFTAAKNYFHGLILINPANNEAAVAALLALVKKVSQIAIDTVGIPAEEWEIIILEPLRAEITEKVWKMN